MYVCIDLFMHVCMHVYVCIYVCMYACMHVRVCTALYHLHMKRCIKALIQALCSFQARKAKHDAKSRGRITICIYAWPCYKLYIRVNPNTKSREANTLFIYTCPRHKLCVRGKG